MDSLARSLLSTDPPDSREPYDRKRLRPLDRWNYDRGSERVGCSGM